MAAEAQLAESHRTMKLGEALTFKSSKHDLFETNSCQQRPFAEPLVCLLPLLYRLIKREPDHQSISYILPTTLDAANPSTAI